MFKGEVERKRDDLLQKERDTQKQKDERVSERKTGERPERSGTPEGRHTARSREG